MADNLSELYATHSWIGDLAGGDAALAQEIRDTILGWVVDGLTAGEIILELRKTSWHHEMFPGLIGDDGTLVSGITGEADYRRRQEQYEGVLRQYAPAFRSDDPRDFVSFFEQGILPEELEQRFIKLDSLKHSSQDVVDAFYVYANLEIDETDLYDAVINPSRRQQLIDEYQSRAQLNPPSMGEFMNRITRRTMDRVVDLIGELADAGLVSNESYRGIANADFATAKQLVGELYLRKLAQRGGDTPGADRGFVMENETAAAAAGLLGQWWRDVPEEGAGALSLSEITHSLQYAMLAGAASEYGFELPTRERLDEFIQAGVTRAKAIQAYSTIATRGREWQAFARRSGLRIREADMENLLLLGEENVVKEALAREAALGQTQGAARFGLNQRTGRLEQSGLGLPRRV